MMSCGKLWVLPISRVNILARSAAALEPTDSGTKWAIFVNLSTVTQSPSHPPETGKPVMSIEMDG